MLSTTSEGACTLLVTGGTGFVGSHTTLELLLAGHRVIVVDNLCNSYLEALRRVSELAFGTTDLESETVKQRLLFYEVDLTDYSNLLSIFRKHKGEISGVIHFAGLKSVPDSVSHPLKYFHNNVVGSLNLLNCMASNNVHNIIFSSSASVYGIPKDVPIAETCSLCPISPYGETKIIVERLLHGLCLEEEDDNEDTNNENSDISITESTQLLSSVNALAATFALHQQHRQEPSSPNSHSSQWTVIILRYFNPCGAHPSGILGECPKDTAHANLMPLLAKVALGEQEKLTVYANHLTKTGNDAEEANHSEDTSPIRDYIHVCDLAKGHVAAISKFGSKQVHIYNLGIGKGSSVLQLVDVFVRVTGKEIAYTLSRPRRGDPPVLIADTTKANSELSWDAEYNMEDMCTHFWKWLQNNPHGYQLVDHEAATKNSS